jgi:hypothetical protein
MFKAIMKKCKNCLKELLFNCFYKHAQMKDGFLNICIECVKTRVKIHRADNLEEIKRYDRLRGRTLYRQLKIKEYADKNREKVNKIKQEWGKRNRLKTRAHLAVRRAVKKGVLEKKCCEICLNEKVEAHHPDYAEPLKVVWLCRKHHGEIHRKYKDETL